MFFIFARPFTSVVPSHARNFTSLGPHSLPVPPVPLPPSFLAGRYRPSLPAANNSACLSFRGFFSNFWGFGRRFFSRGSTRPGR